jgi:cell division protein FtsX
VICVLCQKILCPQAEDFLQLRVLKEEERKIAPQINSEDGVKETKFFDCQQSQNNFR